MSEAWGTVVFNFSDEIESHIDFSGDSFSLEIIESFFKFAGSAGLINKVRALKKNEFSHEGVEVRDGFLRISIFGDEWMKVIKDLIDNGKNIGVFGSIEHEYGYKEFYSLNDQNNRFFGIVNFEAGDNETDIQEQWLGTIPSEVKLLFPDDFIFEKSNDSTLSDHSPWIPSSDSDFVYEKNEIIRTNRDIFNSGIYCTDFLIKSKSLGAQLIDPTSCGYWGHPYSDLHYVISSLELNVAEKHKIINDILDIYSFDIDSVCSGYGNSSGTALFLAADNGLYEIVKRLLHMGANPNWENDESALAAAQSSLEIMPDVQDEPHDSSHIGSVTDFKNIVDFLEQLKARI